MSTFAFGASLFGALAAGRGTAFIAGTAFYDSPFLATVTQMLFTGSTETVGVFGSWRREPFGECSQGEEGGRMA